MILKIGAFFPSSNTFREIYGNVNPSYELQANLVFGKFSRWANTSWVQKKGKSIGFKHSTHVYISSTTLGVSYRFPTIKKIPFYAGLGPNFEWIWLHNKLLCYSRKVSKFVLEISVKTGCRINIPTHFYINAFVHYVYQVVSFETRQDIGGFTPVLGLGYEF